MADDPRGGASAPPSNLREYDPELLTICPVKPEPNRFPDGTDPRRELATTLARAVMGCLGGKPAEPPAPIPDNDPEPACLWQAWAAARYRRADYLAAFERSQYRRIVLGKMEADARSEWDRLAGLARKAFERLVMTPATSLEDHDRYKRSVDVLPTRNSPELRKAYPELARLLEEERARLIREKDERKAARMARGGVGNA